MDEYIPGGYTAGYHDHVDDIPQYIEDLNRLHRENKELRAELATERERVAAQLKAIADCQEAFVWIAGRLALERTTGRAGDLLGVEEHARALAKSMQVWLD